MGIWFVAIATSFCVDTPPEEVTSDLANRFVTTLDVFSPPITDVREHQPETPGSEIDEGDEQYDSTAMDSLDFDAPLESDCYSDADCITQMCIEFGDVFRCTEHCVDVCEAAGFVCFDGLCTPEDHCDDSEIGPGCEDECGDCAINADCVDAGSSTQRCQCRPGYVGDGHSCLDIDECVADDDDCVEEIEICVNIGGGFLCNCNIGYQPNMGTCTDINECASDSPICDPGDCVNDEGTYHCLCPSFFQDNGITCVDIDECETAAICGVGDCVNDDGTGYHCVSN